MGIYDSNYNLICTYEYDSYGAIISIKDAIGNTIEDETYIVNINPYRYRSYYYDKETNLYYLNSRYYNPLWVRFLNADGIINANRDFLCNNLYIYVSNNPILIAENGIFIHFKTVQKLFTSAIKIVTKFVSNFIGISINIY